LHSGFDGYRLGLTIWHYNKNVKKTNKNKDSRKEMLKPLFLRAKRRI